MSYELAFYGEIDAEIVLRKFLETTGSDAPITKRVELNGDEYFDGFMSEIPVVAFKFKPYQHLSLPLTLNAVIRFNKPGELLWEIMPNCIIFLKDVNAAGVFSDENEEVIFYYKDNALYANGYIDTLQNFAEEQGIIFGRLNPSGEL